MKIITATIAHLNQVYDLICELQDGKPDKDNFSQIYKDNISNQDIYYFLAFNEECAVGFASLHVQKLLHHCAKIGEIQEIIVSQAQQGTGVGAMLFDRLRETAIANNCEMLEVCCNKARENSHRFYLRQGMGKSHFKFTYSLKGAVSI